uniref:phospholipase A2 n=1 Tax=Plectus sambesii TaxID=2011161 RepID=A0A914VU86_9BILA
MFVVELLRRYQKYVAKKNGIESDSDTEDGGALSRRGSMIPLSLSSMWRTSRKKSMASNWIPADPVELVVFPPELLVTHTAIVPTGRRSRGRHPVFAIFKARQYNRDDNDEALHHVILTLESDGNLVSIYRSNSYQETFDLYQSCVACDQLFYLLDSSKEEASTAIPRLLNQLIKHPLWRAGHIAAALGLVSYFERMRKQRQLGVIHEPCRPEKYYPHMIAIENNNIELATMLATMGADLSETDANGNNAMHFAALASPEMLEALWAFEPTHDLINKQNNDGYAPLLYSIRHANARCTAKLAGYGAQLKLQFEGVSNPLFTAMQSSSNSVDVIRALLDSSPELIDETDPQTGNRAIHAAFSKKPLTALLILKGSTIDVNARNTLGQTALHVYAFKGDLGCVMSLASNNADLNAVDANGDTALHIAVCHANLLIVRALLCLGADVNIKNHVGDSPRHLAAKFIGQEREDLLHSLKICGAYRCSEWRIECREGCASKHINPQMSVISKKSTAESVDSLVDFIVDSTVNNAVDYTDEGIDAGDLKAAAVEERLDAMPATREAKVHDTMQNLCYQNSLADLKDEKKKERMINLLSLDGGGIRGLVIIQLLMAIEEALHDNVFDYFDWVAGTSTGSILALALAEGWQKFTCMQYA